MSQAQTLRSQNGSSTTVREGDLCGTEASVPDVEPTAEEVQRKPWKYVGYRRYADFISSDDDFFILRRFSSLNVRITLALQDKISVLEEELAELDRRYSSTTARDVNNGTLRGDLQEREELLDTIAERLYQYNESIFQQTKLRSYTRAPHRDIKSIRNWHYNHDYQAISPAEQQYLDHDDDLIHIAETNRTPLRKVIDSSQRLRTLGYWKDNKNETPTYDADNVSYYSDKRMDGFATAVIIFIGVSMLVTPLWVLRALDDLDRKLAVITVFVLAFLLVMSFAMVTKPFEALGATAAYAAILMVFVQVGPN